MKITCDLCGGMLQINSGGQGATCENCGIGYTMARLREKLNEQQNPPKTVDPQPVSSAAAIPAPEFPQTETTKNDIPVQQSAVTSFAKNNIPEPEFTTEELPEPIVPEIELPESGFSAPDSIPQDPDDVILCDVPDFTKENPSKRSFDFTPKPFVMDITGGGSADLCGRVKQGGIGLGDKVYVDGDYSTPYRVTGINNNPANTCAKAGMTAGLYVDVPTFKRRKLKKASTVTGDRQPIANAYNYPGTVQEYFTDLLSAEFSQYEIRTNVDFAELDIPVNFMFCRAGNPVLAIFLSNSNAGTKAEKASRILNAAGVVSVRFFDNYRNDAPYVIDRIKGALGI